MQSALLLLQLASTLFMTGLIWFVQVVHYPLFAAVGREGFARYEGLHTIMTGWVVVPVMIVELASAVGLVVLPPAGIARVWPMLGLGLLSLVWLTTALYSVPAHGSLARGFADDAHSMLVATNWVRTLGWSARAMLVLWITAALIET